MGIDFICTKDQNQNLILKILLFSGVFRNAADILLRAKLALADGVTMQLTVRSTDPDVAESVTQAIA